MILGTIWTFEMSRILTETPAVQTILTSLLSGNILLVSIVVSINSIVLSHDITSVGIPWEQERYTDPLADVTDPSHRQRVDGTSPEGLTNRVVGRVRQLDSGSSGALGRVTDEARQSLDDAITVSLSGLPVECAVRLASEGPEATVTRNGVFGYLHVDPGEHLLVVNGPGYAPIGQRFVHDGGLFQAGSDGELTVVAREDTGWIRGDGRETNGVSHVRVIEDYAGVVYDGRPVENDRFAVAVHRDGRYTVEVVDADGRPGAYRVGPDTFDDGFEDLRESIETGKASLTTTLLAELEELSGLGIAGSAETIPTLESALAALPEAVEIQPLRELGADSTPLLLDPGLGHDDGEPALPGTGLLHRDVEALLRCR